MNFLHHVLHEKNREKVHWSLLLISLFIFFGTYSYYFQVQAVGVITGVNSQNVSASSAQIIWQTDTPASSKVYYGTSSGTYPSASTSYCGSDTGAGVFNHCVSLTGLLPGTQYYVKVESIDTQTLTLITFEGYSFNTTSGGGTPVAPSGLVVSNPTGTTINSSWVDNSTNEMQFNLYARKVGDSAWTTLASVPMNVTLYVATPSIIISGNNYEFYVEACTSTTICSGPSNIVSVNFSGTVGDMTPPSAPVLSVSPTSSQITLNWTASTDDIGIAGYGVYLDTTSTLVPAAQHSYTYSTLTAGTNYSFHVTACDASGKCTSSNTVSSALLGSDIIAPSTPINLRFDSTSPTTVNLSWDASTDNIGVKEYQIYRDGSFLSSATGNSLSITSGIYSQTNYEFKVRAIDAAGNLSYFSAPIVAVTSADSQAPTAPTELTATLVSSSQINIAWTPSTDNIGVAGYDVYRNGTKVTSLSVGTGNYLSSGLSPDTLYLFEVKALDAAHNTSAPATLSVTTHTDSPTLPAPSNLTASTAGTTNINLVWTAPTVAGISGYKIYVNGTFLKNATLNSASITGLNANVDYSFNVTAFGTNIGESPLSNTAFGRISSALNTLAMPTGLFAKVISSTEVNFSWAPPTSTTLIIGYKIYKDGALYSSLSGATTILITGLTPGTTYHFTVRSFDAAGNLSPESVSVSATTLGSADTSLPSTPDNFKATALSSSKVSLSWSASIDNVGVRGYNIFRNSGFLASVTGTTYTDTGRAPATKYSYQVAAYDAAGNISKRTNSVTATTLSSSVTTTTTTTVTPTGNPVTFFAKVGNGICKNGISSAPVTFFINPLNGGNIKVSGTLIGSETHGSGTIELKSGYYTWVGVTKDGFSVSGSAKGSFTVPTSACKETATPVAPATSVTNPVVSPVETPVFSGTENEIAPTAMSQEVFATYSETDAALKKEAAVVIPANATILEKLEIVQTVRNSYALAPESPTVMIGGTQFSRINAPATVVAAAEKIIQERTASSSLIDMDIDGVSDYDETSLYGTDPKKTDTDSDGINDGDEITAGTNPLEKNIAPIAYESPKMNTVFASTSKDSFTVDKAGAILSPAVAGETAKVIGVALEGKALPNSYVTLYIFSTPVVVTVKTDETGRWTYTIDKEMENGKHDVYVAMTESSGKIIAKSSPIPFVKTADAVSLGAFIPVAEAAVSTNQGLLGGNSLFVSIGAIAFAVIAGLIALSVILKRKTPADGGGDNQQNV